MVSSDVDRPFSGTGGDSGEGIRFRYNLTKERERVNSMNRDRLRKPKFIISDAPRNPHDQIRAGTEGGAAGGARTAPPAATPPPPGSERMGCRILTKRQKKYGKKRGSKGEKINGEGRGEGGGGRVARCPEAPPSAAIPV
jgi:hypothetical protein